MNMRFTFSDLPDVIAVFPLPGALLLPRARLPLNIFEPRYLAMLDDALKSDHRMIGMVQPIGDSSKGASKLQKVGCAGRITSLTETEDGRYVISLTGISRFRLGGEIEGFTPYRRVQADWASFEGDLGPSENDKGLKRDAFLSALKRYFDAEGLSSDWDSLKDADAEMLINSLSMLCPFSPEDKQALLEAPQLTDRRETLMALMEFAIASHGDEGPMQ